jgi:hypothetical protein
MKIFRKILDKVYKKAYSGADEYFYHISRPLPISAVAL